MDGQQKEGSGRSYGNNRFARDKRYQPNGGKPWKVQHGNGRIYTGNQQQESGRNQATTGQRRPDEDILHDVTARLAQHGQINAADIDVTIQDGQVTLRGSVNTCDESRFAELATEAIPGVIRVHNEMEVREDV